MNRDDGKSDATSLCFKNRNLVSLGGNKQVKGGKIKELGRVK